MKKISVIARCGALNLPPFSTLLFFLMLTAINLFSQDQNYDAVYLKIRKEFTLNADGSIDYRYFKQQKLQTYRSFHNLYGETFIVYNPEFQSLKVNECYTVMADGKKAPSPANAFNEVLPAFAANAPAYNKLREMVITHAGTEKNAILNLDYVLHSKKGFYPCLMGNELLCEAEPVKVLTVVIKVPQGMKLNFSMLNTKSTPVVTEESGSVVYTISCNNINAISSEENQAGGNVLYPRVIFSTAPDRNSVYETLINRPAFDFGMNEGMRQMVKTIAGQYKEKEDIVLKLQEKVINEFRLYPVPMRFTGFDFRTPEESWNSNGGTLMEKALLLTALLREAGINETNPVFLIHGQLYNEAIGSLLDIDDILVRTTIPDAGVICLSVNSLNPQDLALVNPGRIFVELRKGAVSAGKASPVEDKVKFSGSFAINDKKQMTGSITSTESQGVNPWLLLLRDKDKARSLFGGGLTSADLKDPVSINSGKDESSMSFQVFKDKPMRNDSDYYFLQLPTMTNGIDNLGIHLLPHLRFTPFEITSAIQESNEFTYVIPDNMKPFLPEDKKIIRNNSGEFNYEMKTNGQRITVRKTIMLNKRFIEPEDYAGFKALIDHWNAERYHELVLTQVK